MSWRYLEGGHSTEGLRGSGNGGEPLEQQPRDTSRALKYQDAASLLRQFEDAVDQSHILPADSQSAFTYEALRVRLKPEDYRAEAEKLRVAFEDQGQQVLLKYLAGDSPPQSRAD